MKGRPLTPDETFLVRLCGALDMTQDEARELLPCTSWTRAWHVKVALRESRPPPVPTDWLPDED